jgi:predicted SnoaL-like aldol condensation-catalyzing enzyme
VTREVSTFDRAGQDRAQRVAATPRHRTVGKAGLDRLQSRHQPHEPAGVRHGKDGVREGFTALLADLPDAKWDVPTQIFDGDILFIEWSAVSAATQVSDGVDTFVFGGEGIRVQTVRCTLTG